MNSEIIHAPPGSPGAEGSADIVVTELFRAHRLALVRLAFLLVGDQESAEDVVQDTFAAVFRRWSKLSDRGEVLPYLRKAVVNGCRMVLRRRAIIGRFRGHREIPFWSAEAAALLGETRRQVFLAVRALPRRQREALVLRFYLDLSEAEIAQVMGVSRGTVKSTTSRALKVLATQLQEER
ncbi:SigE family RNA polymerase sigma factor [Nonomuraea muscovyensis]|jgi:RNA polymerase sigma-70 factor (sigma-E family)|uniref:RNA polymerase sigma-70 factor (Sigma-E family) n=1 Tax=Nonomuraea muscovyensis TaxID=1124761 RepID=A0A7X0BYY0_9ACTN|nr:SigE family RNA polymerase sigma factor [Nonomuraea muscovyensis]MBB6345173.1 RNA polymerase sigma-70 factor (sigma-E family) [Nonomuraea muscovyensis]